jgi:hypothetical protein
MAWSGNWDYPHLTGQEYDSNHGFAYEWLNDDDNLIPTGRPLRQRNRAGRYGDRFNPFGTLDFSAGGSGEYIEDAYPYSIDPSGRTHGWDIEEGPFWENMPDRNVPGTSYWRGRNNSGRYLEPIPGMLLTPPSGGEFGLLNFTNGQNRQYRYLPLSYYVNNAEYPGTGMNIGRPSRNQVRPPPGYREEVEEDVNTIGGFAGIVSRGPRG